MTLQEVRQFLKENAEKDDVKSYLSELSKISPDQEEQIINNYKVSQDFKSEIDRAVSRGVNTFKEKSLPDIIAEKEKTIEAKIREELDPPKNPEVVKLTEKMKQYETELKKTQDKTIRESIKNYKQKVLAEKGLPIELADSIYVKADDLTVKDIEDFEKLQSLIEPAIDPISKFAEAVKTAKANEMLANSATKPTNSNSAGSGQLTRDQYNALPHDERVKAFNEGKCAAILGQQT